MAHVSEDRRGQILVVMSLVMAVLLVAMALYLNTAIYTENLATRQADIAGADGAASYKSATAEGAAGAIRYANRYNNSSYSELRTAIETDLDNWTDANARLEATRSRSANVSVDAITEGTLVIQDDDRKFTNKTGIADWVVANDTQGVRKFRMNVTRDDLGDSWPGNAPHQDDLFTVTFDDGSTVRKVQVYGNKSENDIHVTVLDGGGSELGTCSADDQSRAVVEVTGAKVDGEECEPLRFFGDLGDEYAVVFNNSNMANGTYRMVVNQSYGTFSTEVWNNYYAGTSSSPYFTRAVYAVHVDVVYETTRIEYATVVRVAPGEPE